MTMAASGSRVRLSVFEENRRQPRCTGSHPERMRPHHRPLLEKTPLVLRAHFGSSRVRKTSRATSAESADLALAPRIVRPPPPTLTPILHAGYAAGDAVDGSETSDLLEPRSTAYDSTLLLKSRSINRVFIWVTQWFSSRNPTASLANPTGSLCGDEAFSASSGARGVAPAGPRSPADLATLAPARGRGGGPERLGGGKSLPAADLPNDAVGESAT